MCSLISNRKIIDLTRHTYEYIQNIVGQTR